MDAPKPHKRLSSTDERRRATPRRTTVGPLDAATDDPLANPAPVESAAAAAPSPSTITSPTTSSRPPSNITSPLSPAASTGLEDLPAKDLSFLFEPSIYHPLPPQTIPQPFLTSPHAASLNTPLPQLLSHGHYRVAAVHCARALTTFPDPTDTAQILTLFHTRLACLALLGHHDLAARESKALGDLTSAFYRHPLTGAHAVPWPLRVLAVRLAALGYGEWRKGVMGFFELAREAREEAAKSDSAANRGLWSARLRELGVRVANLLVEMGDLEGAAGHLASLPGGATGAVAAAAAAPGGSGDDERGEEVMVRQMEAMVWLRVGDVGAARRCVARTEAEEATAAPTTLDALIQMADNDYDAAIATWRTLLGDSNPASSPMVAQNLAVCLLYTGRLEAARSLLEALVDAGFSFHTLTFNLSTLYELCSERARDRKSALAERLAEHEPGPSGWEKVAADFKL